MFEKSNIKILPKLSLSPLLIWSTDPVIYFTGMDLVEVGNDEITLRLGKQSNKRHLQFALQSLVSVFSK